MEATVEGNELTLKIHLAKLDEAPISKQGKSRVVASSHGFQHLVVYEGASLAINYNITAPITQKGQ